MTEQALDWYAAQFEAGCRPQRADIEAMLDEAQADRSTPTADEHDATFRAIRERLDAGEDPGVLCGELLCAWTEARRALQRQERNARWFEALHKARMAS